MKKNVFLKYLPHTGTDEAWQIYCTGAGYTEISPGTHYPPRPESHPREYVDKLVSVGRTLNEYQLVYITAGRGLFKSEGGISFDISHGTVFLLFPRVWHTYAPRMETGWTEYWVGFRGPYPEALQKAGFFSPEAPEYGRGLDVPLLQDYQQIFDLAESEPPGFQQRLGATVIQMLAKLIGGTKLVAQSSGATEIVRSIKFIMEEYLFGKLDMETISKKIGLPYSSFAAIFHEYTGLSPHQYFLQLKINHAKIMLADSGASIKEIAGTLDFESEFYFSRLFKKKTGLSPTMWKKSLETPESAAAALASMDGAAEIEE